MTDWKKDEDDAYMLGHKFLRLCYMWGTAICGSVALYSGVNQFQNGENSYTAAIVFGATAIVSGGLAYCKNKTIQKIQEQNNLESKLKQ
jgi:hypothetical protein